MLDPASSFPTTSAVKKPCPVGNAPGSCLRFGDERYPIRKHDVIACPPGGPEVAHQILDTGTTTLRYLALSTIVDVEACEDQDSQKVLVVTGNRGDRRLRKRFRAENTVDDYDRESSEEPPR